MEYDLRHQLANGATCDRPLVDLGRKEVKGGCAQVPAAAEEANRRLRFLARTGAIIGQSLDYKVTSRDIVRLAIPFLATRPGSIAASANPALAAFPNRQSLRGQSHFNCSDRHSVLAAFARGENNGRCHSRSH